MLLEVRDLEAGYGAGRVLFGLDLDVPAGGCASLLGRNGMGKTTVLNALMGLVPGCTGTIRVDGADVAGWPPHRIARTGLALVPEGRQVFPNLSARENLVATARGAGTGDGDGARDWSLERVLALFPALEPRLGSMGNLLSGGEQQMLAIGRALMTGPRLLLLDDATEGLAPRVRADIWTALGELKRAGLAILVVDKHVADLKPLVDRHRVLEKGRVVWEGASGALDAGVAARYLGV